VCKGVIGSEGTGHCAPSPEHTWSPLQDQGPTHRLTEDGTYPSGAVDWSFLLPVQHWAKAAASVPPTRILMIARILYYLDWSEVQARNAPRGFAGGRRGGIFHNGRACALRTRRMQKIVRT